MGYHPITRPMFSQTTLGRARGRRRLADSILDQDPLSNDALPPQGPSFDSIVNFFWPTATGSLSAGVAQIQSVPDNAANANAAAVAAGLPPPYDVASIQSVADQQIAAFGQDNQTIFNPPPTPNDPTTWPWYYWAGIIGGGFLLFADLKK